MNRINDLAEAISNAQYDAYETLGLTSLPDDTDQLDEEIKRNLMKNELFSKSDKKSIEAAVDIADNEYNAHEATDVALRMAYEEGR